MFIFPQKVSIDEKQGKKSKDPFHASNVAFIKRTSKDVPDANNMSNAILNTRTRFIKAIQKHNAELLKDLTDDQLNALDLEYLDKLIKDYDIPLQTKRKDDWRQAEIDIANGFDQLLKNNFFSYQDKTGKILKVDDNKLGVRQIGGPKESDVKIFRRDDEKKCIYIESKLDFMSAEYFKFKLKLSNGQLTYDHKFFLGGLNDEEKQDMNELFKQIDLNGFLNGLLKREDVKEYWKVFSDNIKEVFERLKIDADFKDFTDGITLPSSFPGNTNTLIKIFDTYCKHYIEKYDSIIYQIYDSYGGNEYMEDVSQFTIEDHYKKGDVDYGTVFYNVDDLMSKFYLWNELLDDRGDQTYEIDTKKIISLSDELKTIEVKFSRILENAKIDNPKDLLSLANSKKLMYFFKAFASSVGRKTKSGIPVIGMFEDKLGNMQITPEVQVDGRRLAQMISDYYVKKDHCAYIQVRDVVYQFSKDTNLFQIPNLPTMKECINQFVVKIHVSNEVDEISLHVRALPPEKEVLSRFNQFSFKEKDKNWIGNKQEIIIKQY